MTALLLSTREPKMDADTTYVPKEKQHHTAVLIRGIDINGLIHALELLNNPGVASVEYNHIKIEVKDDE